MRELSVSYSQQFYESKTKIFYFKNFDLSPVFCGSHERHLVGTQLHWLRRVPTETNQKAGSQTLGLGNGKGQFPGLLKLLLCVCVLGAGGRGERGRCKTNAGLIAAGIYLQFPLC